MADLPSYDQLVLLPATTSGVVGDDLLDRNDHVNVEHYFRLTVRACSTFSDDLGFGPVQIPDEGLTTFTAEQHVRYYSELLKDQAYTVRVRYLDRGRASLHAIVYLVDEDRRRLAYSLEDLLIQVDIRSRRPAGIPDATAARLDAVIAEHRALPWEAKVSGSIGIRRS